MGEGFVTPAIARQRPLPPLSSVRGVKNTDETRPQVSTWKAQDMVDVEKCEMTFYPAAVLSKRAEPIEKIDDSIRRLVEKMADVMVERKGIGLAGPQIGVP